MSTLLIRLAGPLQSWGLDAKFDRRGTERAPTKSGVIGLVAAALGRRRNENMDDLNALRFGVRVDREGVLLRDYHIAKSEKSTYVTNRYYLSDAIFLAGLEGDELLLTSIADALQSPMFPLFLGRRSCPPEGRVLLGIHQGKSLMQALKDEPWLSNSWVQEREQKRREQAKDVPLPALRLVLDSGGGETGIYFTRDVPLSFDQTHRRFGFRRVSDFNTTPPNGIHKENGVAVTETPTDHDPMQELEG